MFGKLITNEVQANLKIPNTGYWSFNYIFALSISHPTIYDLNRLPWYIHNLSVETKGRTASLRYETSSAKMEIFFYNLSFFYIYSVDH